jgi:hypothetical protein
MGTGADGVGADTTVDFDVFVRETGAELCDLGHASLEELLAAAA